MQLIVLLLSLIGVLVAPAVCAAQPVSAADRDALVRLRTEQGGRAEEVDQLIRIADETAAKGLPAGPLTNKIREGLAKKHDPKRIEGVIRQMAASIDVADRFIREVEPGSNTPQREAAVTLLSEALVSGLTIEEVRELRRVASAGKPAPNGQAMANGSKGLSFIKEVSLPMPDGTAVIGEALRQGYQPQDLLDVGREVKRRAGDYRSGRASLRALRDAIARGDRPEQLFRAARPDTVERPAATRPDTVERPARPETPQRPDTVRPERPATGRDR